MFLYYFEKTPTQNSPFTIRFCHCRHFLALFIKSYTIVVRIKEIAKNDCSTMPLAELLIERKLCVFLLPMVYHTDSGPGELCQDCSSKEHENCVFVWVIRWHLRHVLRAVRFWKKNDNGEVFITNKLSNELKKSVNKNL